MAADAIPVTYVDLGPRNGMEIRAFLKVLRFVPGIRIRVHAVEANPYYAGLCEEAFRNDRRVKIHNVAIGSSEGVARFYLDPKGAGSSIYGDKGNVDKYIRVSRKRFSKWLADECVLPQTDAGINVLKANIEGAEWDLIQDMDRQDLFKEFNIFCGPGSRVGGWVGDISKVPSIARYRPRAERMLERHEVQVREWHGSCKDMFDMRGAVLEGMRHRGRSTRGAPVYNTLAAAVGYLEARSRAVAGVFGQSILGGR